MLAILDYKAGNQTSVFRALRHLGVEACVTAEPERLLAAEGVIFPGVGAAGQAMELLTSSGLDLVLRDLVERGRPLLGICLGCQILLSRSEEGDTPGLGLISGLCRRFQPQWTDGGQPVRIPHMGWNSLCPAAAERNGGAERILAGIDSSARFYFVHGYYPQPAPELILATTTYGVRFASVFGRPGLWAAQFHPEKSGRPGLRLLENFYLYCREQYAN